MEYFFEVEGQKTAVHALFERRVTAYFQRRSQLLSLLSISPASMQIQNASSLALPGPDHVCARRSQS